MFDDLPKLKRQVDAIQTEADKAAGAEEQWMREAKKEFGCKTLAEAVRRLADLGELERQTDRIAGRKLKRFRRRFKKYLRKISNDDD